jgi:SAM-dependent methyltransferase
LHSSWQLPWHSSPLAQQLRRVESAVLGRALDDVFGFELMQLGAWGSADELLAGARTSNRTVVDQQCAEGVDLVARMTQLPVPSSSIDAVVLPHTLEFESDPHSVLREADRVLAGEGQILILGFRPSGPWGWRARASRAGFPPGLRRVLPEHRVRDWLRLLRYEITGVQRYLYALPVQPSGDPAQTEALGLRRGWFYPWPSGAYLLKARKRLYAAPPLLRVRRRERRALLGEVLETGR